MRSIRSTMAGVALAALVAGMPARADLWAYVDADGRSHVADHQVDARSRLFFKGDTTLDVRRNQADQRAAALRALAGTRLLARATDERVTARYAAVIEHHARSNDLDPALVKAVVAVESAFDAQALSPKGAVGLMQVIPDTGERYGLVADAQRSVAQKLLDPSTNVRIGTRYLRDLLDRFANSVPLALAAYNAGEGSVRDHDDGIPPFAETRDFVRRVELVYTLYRPPPAPPEAPIRLPRLQRSPAQRSR